MGHRLTYTFVVLLALLSPLLAQVSPQDQFLQLYFSLQEAERLEQDGQLATARDRYKDVADKLDNLKKDHPEWEPGIVNFRIKFVADKIAQLTDKTDANPGASAAASATATTTPLPPGGIPSAPASAPTFAAPPAPSAPATNPDDTDALKARVASLEKELADTKLQLTGALAQATDLRQRLDAAERELATAKSSNLEERVASIMDENNSLKAQLADAQTKIKALQDGSSTDTSPLKQQLQDVQQQLAALENENQTFKATNNDLKQQLEEAKAKLGDSDKQVAQQANADSVHRENDILRGILTRQLQEQARRDAAKHLAAEEINNLHIESKVLAQQIDILSSPIITLSPDERSLLRLDAAAVVPASTTLEAHLDSAPVDSSMAAGTPPPSSAPQDPAAPAAVPDPSAATPAAPASNTDTPPPDLASKPKVPDEMRPLAQQANDDFSQGKYDDAAAVYNKIIEHYPDSLYAWSNLGVVRFQQQRYPEAEKALLESIKLNPNDAFSYSILGIVYYQEGRFDDAIDKLTRASTLDPNDARTRNYLGIACSQKGWQEAAEKQLRKAIEIDPTLGDAQFNLAVIYATQKPPARELARKHYKAALDLGIPKDPQLEKFFSDDSAETAPASTPAPAAAPASDASATTPATAPVPMPPPATTPAAPASAPAPATASAKP